MSEDYHRAEPQITSKGSLLLERIKEMMKESILQQEEEPPTPAEIESLQISNEKFVGKIDVDTKAQQLTSFRYTDDDIKIKDYFEKQITQLPIAFFDIDTSQDFSFKFSDLAMIGFDKKDNSLKMINTLSQEVDLQKKRNIMKTVLMKKQFLEIKQEAMQLEQKYKKSKEFKDVEVIYEDELMEEVTKVILSSDKSKIIMGTSYGKLTILDVKNFKPLIILNNPIQTPVTDIVEKRNIVVVGYSNGQIIVFQRPMAFSAYSSYELRKADNDPIRALKLSNLSHHIIAIKEDHLDKQDKIVDQFAENFISHEEIFNIKSFDLILYDLKELKEVGQTELFSSNQQSFEFNKLFDFSKECFVMLSPDQCSFRVYSLKNCKLISQGPDNIDPSTIQYIKALDDSKNILVVSFNGDSYFFELQGKENMNPKNINFVSYMITPCGTNEMLLVNLPEKVTLFKFPKKLYNQLVLFEEDERWLYFSDEKESFMLQLQQIKPKFQKIINAKMTLDQQILFYTYKAQNTHFMDIVHFKSGTILKTYKQYEPITTSYNSQFVFCEDVQNKKIIRLNLKTLESEFIKGSCGQVLIASRFGNLIYCSQKDLQTQKYKLICMELSQKSQTAELDLQFDEDFYFQISNDENHLIISTKDGRLIKVNCSNPKQLNFIEAINHLLGYTSYINFQLNDNHFICGGHLSSDLYIYNFHTMRQVKRIDNHCQSTSQGYFVSKNRLVTKNDKKLIYWNWNGTLELLFQVDQPNQLVKGFNSIITGLVLNNEISLWSEELTHELAQSIIQIQPSDLRKEWSIGPIILVQQLIINHFYSVNEQEKIKLLPHLLKYTILPYGYTFLCKLVYLNQKQLIIEALKFKELTYKRDIYGNTALIYALKSKDQETIDNILLFLAQNKKYITTIRFQALTLLFQSAPLQLIPFLEKSVMKLEGFQKTGQKINDEQQTYFEQDSQSRLIHEKVYSYLCNEKCQEVEKFPIVFQQSMININYELGSIESIQLSQAIEACPDEKIFKTTFIINLLNHKWQKIKPFANFLLLLQVCFTATVSIHSFQPGNTFYIHILQAQNYFWAAIEFIIFLQSDYKFTYNSKINLWLFMVLNVYCYNTLEGASPFIDNLLPMINWLAWFQMTLQLQQFDLIRTFCCVFLNAVNALDGFCYFLLLMMFTFSTTQDIIEKNHDRYQKYGNDRGPYNEQFYLDHNITQTFDDNLFALWDTFFKTWVAIVKGDFTDDKTIVLRLFVLLSTFISNVVLLNLIIAFMSDSYSDVMGTIFEKKNKTLNYMTVRLEKVLFWRKKYGQKSHLIWVDYENETGLAHKKSETLPELIENTHKKCLEEFEKNQRLQFNDLQSQVVQTRQKLFNQINKQESVLSNFQEEEKVQSENTQSDGVLTNKPSPLEIKDKSENTQQDDVEINKTSDFKLQRSQTLQVEGNQDIQLDQEESNDNIDNSPTKKNKKNKRK